MLSKTGLERKKKINASSRPSTAYASVIEGLGIIAYYEMRSDEKGWPACKTAAERDSWKRTVTRSYATRSVGVVVVLGSSMSDSNVQVSQLENLHVQQSQETSFIARFLENKLVKSSIIGFPVDRSSLVHTSRLVSVLWQVSGDYITLVHLDRKSVV